MDVWARALVAAAKAQSYSGVVRIVQWCVIALVFLFFLRVMRAVWVEVRPAGPRQVRAERRRAAREETRAIPASAPGRRSKGVLFLDVVEPEDRAGDRFSLDGETTIGRSPGCGIATTYDIYSSTLHARLFRDNGRVYVEDLGSTNGTFVNSERITKPTKLGRGDILQVGATVFQVSR
jgi:pSer/pThr/pTyr-binding forkhead associated (FHA) protein